MKNNVMGMMVYFTLTVLLGAAVGVLALIIKENSDRVAYYDGKWNKGDLARGCLAVALGVAVVVLINYLLRQ